MPTPNCRALAAVTVLIPSPWITGAASHISRARAAHPLATLFAAAANRAQTYFHFDLVHLPTPSGAVVNDFGSIVRTARRYDPPPQFYLPFLDHYFRDLPKRFAADRVICLTKHLVAGDFDGDTWWSLFTASSSSNARVTVMSTNELRAYARRAKVSYEKAVLFLAVGALLDALNRNVEYHDETCGCPLDFCEDRDDVVKGLKHMRFDHEECRAKVRDKAQLAAVDALLALDVPSAVAGG